VDAFLLLGGFFVGASLLRRAGDGSLWLRAYIAKVARRFLPVVGAAVGFLLIAGVAVYPPARWSDLSEQAIASMAMVENWWLAAEGTAYGGADVGASPFQHLWSLSIQAQLYIAIALLLVLLARVLRVLRLQIVPALTLVLGGLAIASFVYASVRVHSHPVWAYFDTAARAWEVLLGVLVALALAKWSLPSPIASVLGWIGMSMLLSTMWLVDGATAFPGPAALLPIGGTLLVIVAGRTPTRFGVDAVLRCAPVVAAGSIAFGVYVWHWPLLVLYLQITGRDDVGLMAGLALIASSVVLGLASWKFIEGRISRVRTARPLAILAVCAVLLVAVPSAWLVHMRASALGAEAVAAAPDQGSDVEAAPELTAVLAAATDAPVIYSDGCIAREREVVTCTYGDEGSDRTLALVGGSHSGQWFAPLEQLANEHGFRVVTYLRDECYFGAPGLDLFLSEDCDAWNTRVAEKLIADRVDLVFTTSTRSEVVEEQRIEWVPKGYQKSWEELSRAGIAVVALRDTPWFDLDPLDCLSAGGDGTSCGTRRADVLSIGDPLAGVALPAGVTPIDLNDVVCPDRFCPVAQRGMVMYRDDNHLTSGYASSLASQLGERLGPASGWWQPRASGLGG
jgi:peptidoglycan/LPS O-acetylase OafA/YrhL